MQNISPNFQTVLVFSEMSDDHDRFSVILIPRKLKLFTCYTSAPLMQTGVYVFISFFLKSTISSLVSLTIIRLFSVHHCVRLLISSQYEFSFSIWWWCSPQTSQQSSLHVRACSHGCTAWTGGGWALKWRRCDHQIELSGVFVRKSNIQFQSLELEPRVLNLPISFVGEIVLNTELNSANSILM